MHSFPCYIVGDNYWLEDMSNERKKTTSQPSTIGASEARNPSLVDASLAERGALAARVIISDSRDGEEVAKQEL